MVRGSESYIWVICGLGIFFFVWRGSFKFCEGGFLGFWVFFDYFFYVFRWVVLIRFI